MYQSGPIYPGELATIREHSHDNGQYYTKSVDFKASQVVVKIIPYKLISLLNVRTCFLSEYLNYKFTSSTGSSTLSLNIIEKSKMIKTLLHFQQTDQM